MMLLPLLSLLSINANVNAFIASPLHTGAAIASLRTTNQGGDRFCRHAFYNDFEKQDDDEDDEDAMIDADSLGDWRAFRRSLSSGSGGGEEAAAESRTVISEENEELLESQSEEMANEYRKDVWAHATAVPEVGGLVVRMPLEVELYRNFKHSMNGRKLRKQHKQIADNCHPALYYKKAQRMVEDTMLEMITNEGDDHTIDVTKLPKENAELLQLYLDNQENWQEVCLVVSSSEKTTCTVVLNRPMALKLTESLAQVLLFGNDEDEDSDELMIIRSQSRKKKPDDLTLVRFMLAFGPECAVYIGGPDKHNLPARILHGFKDLEGAKEIARGAGIYEGGLEAAIDGVLRGKYRPLDFRFFYGHHEYSNSGLELSVVLGKYQPVACARSLVLKQCLGLPKPLWHEVLETCGGELSDISDLELQKREDVSFQIIDDDDDDDDENEIVDELDQLWVDDEEDDDDVFYRK